MPPADSNTRDRAPRKGFRFNLKGFLVFGGILLTLAVLYFPLNALSNRSLRSSALNQAREIAAKGDLDLVLRHLDRYLARWPDDREALEEMARIRTETAASFDQVVAAAGLNDQIVRLDPEAPASQVARRRLVQMWLRQGAMMRGMAQNEQNSSRAAQESRYHAALAVARDLTYGVRRDGALKLPGVDSAESHRLLAQCLDALVATGEAKNQDEAIREFHEALRLDPADWYSAERIAQHFVDTRKDPAGARKVMDALLAAGPASPDVRLSRHRYFRRVQDEPAAKAEMEAAVLLRPDSTELRLAAANDGIRRGDSAAAQAHLDALPAATQDDPRVRKLRGLMDFTRGDNEAAIDQFRKGLAAVGGSDPDLTFYLARALILLNRLPEARPLVAQFQRLEGEDSRAVARFLKALYDQRMGHPTRAINDLKVAENQVPESLKGEVQLTLGRCYETINELFLARMAFRKAIEFAPRSPEPRRESARLLMASNPQEAVDEIDRALAIAPRDTSLLYEAARLHLARQEVLPPEDRRWFRLLELLDQADKMAPKEFRFRWLRSDYLFAMGKPDEALDLLDRSVRGPDKANFDAWVILASRLERAGRRADALKALEEAGAPEAAGDHAPIRLARSTLLTRSGRGQEAREVLTRDRNRVPKSEQPQLSRAVGDLARDMGDRDAARAAYLEWSRLVPDSAEPGLSLMALGKLLSDEEATRLGIASLRAIGGDREPYGLAALAMDLLKVNPGQSAFPSPEKLDKAEKLLDRLREEAPQLMVGHILRGILLEFRNKLPESATEYRLALKDGGGTTALIGLVSVLTKLRKFDELSSLQKSYEDEEAAGRKPGESGVGFDQISSNIALREGDKDRAEYFASRIVEQLPDSLEARANLARLLDNLGKPQQAEETLRELVKRRPNDPSSWIALSNYQAIRGKPEDTARTVEEIRRTYKGERIELLLGRCYWMARDVKAAAAEFAAALKKGPDDPATLRDLAEFDLANDRPAEFEAVLRRASKLNLAWANQALAIRLSSGGDPASWAEAWSIVEPGAKTSGDSPEDRLLRATVLARCPDPIRRSGAVSTLVDLTRDLPVNSVVAMEARIRLAQAMLELNRPAEAESFIAPVADDTRQPNPIALATSTEALARSGRAAEAASRLDRLVAVEPKSIRTTAARIWVFAAQGRRDEAIGLLEEGLTEAMDRPDGEPIAVAFVDLARKIGREGEAEKVAVRVAQKWPTTAYLVARFQEGRGKFAEALASCRVAAEAGSTRESLKVATNLILARRADAEFLKQAHALGELARSKSPRALDVLIFQATLCHLQRQYEEEVALYREARGLNPVSLEFLNNLAWTLSEGLGKYDEALGLIDEVVRRYGRVPQFLDTRGVVLARLGRFDQAIVDLEESVKGDPAAATYFHLARTYYKSGRAEDYRRCRDLARKAKFDPDELDLTDRADLEEVMLNRK